MLAPRTPTKASGDGIEKICEELGAKWGLYMPLRGGNWSPAHIKHDRIEDKIYFQIKFLYFKNRDALQHALQIFEKHASEALSQWHYKPHGERDVIPSHEPSQSTVRRDTFLRRNRLEEAAEKDLMKSLFRILEEVRAQNQRGEAFGTSDTVSASVEGDAITMALPRAKAPIYQASLTSWFRSRSEPGVPPNPPSPQAQNPSSDDYQDREMTDVVNDVDATALASSDKVSAVTSFTTTTTLEQTSPSDEEFQTPPSTPSRSNNTIGLGIKEPEATARNRVSPVVFQKPDPIPFLANKRSYPEAITEPSSRKMSRGYGPGSSLYHVNHVNPSKDPLKPSDLSYMVPTPPLDANPFFTRIPSFDNISSVSSSMTAASTTWTSPNTSFNADSMATSFSSTGEDTDATARPPVYPSRPKFPADQSARWLELDQSKDVKHEGAESLSKTTAKLVSDKMDIDVKFAKKNLTVTFDEGRNIDPVVKQVSVPAPKNLVPQSELSLEASLLERLVVHSPFVPRPLEQNTAVPLRQLYEITRVAAHCGLDLSLFKPCMERNLNSYDELWSLLSRITQSNGSNVPERSSLAAWDQAGANFEGVALTGKLKMLDQPKGPVYQFQLNPLKMESSYRLSREFGSDRFCVIGIPGLELADLPSSMRSDPAPARRAIVKWLVDTEHRFLGRTWRAFYTKPESRKIGLKKSGGKIRYRLFFFAENGNGFKTGSRNDNIESGYLARQPMTVKSLVEWFMSAKVNEDRPCLKFFARLALGVSSTTKTIKFEPHEIFLVDDAHADAPGVRRLDSKRSEEKKRDFRPDKSKSPVMNDGCARISQDAARAIADSVGLDSVPCAFQGRIGGAKGVWMVDVLDETPFAHGRNYWIEITDSQLKFNPNPSDTWYPSPARVTFEVNDYPKKLTSGSLHFQLLPILVNRKVPPEIFIKLLENDLTTRIAELEVAMDSGLALRRWNQSNFPVTEERARYGGIEMQGGLPLSRSEKINWFVEHGFEPTTCRYLKEQLYQAILAYCLRLESKMNIGLAESTYAFMIADPLAILEANEVHIGFSSAFKDPKSGIDLTMLHDTDVLVARSPAHLPSDIQKVRAVFRPELRMYRDVIVFPSRGSVALASKLSGGDYDGDKAWICWNSEIVEPFQNVEVPAFPSLDFYGIEKEETKVSDLLVHSDYMNRFLRHAFSFNLQNTMLGICTAYHEAYCYHTKCIDSPEAINLGILLGNLVDSAKAGFTFDDAKWAAFLERRGLNKSYPKPAYKDRRNARPTNHLIDHLVFVTAKDAREDLLGKFAKRFADITPRDDDLFRDRKEAVEDAKNNEALAKVLQSLEEGLKGVNTFWRKHVRVDKDEEVVGSSKNPNALSFRNVVERCRQDFLNLAPNIPPNSSPDTRILSWKHDHALGRSSDWDRLKASVAFSNYYSSNFIWHVAGVELGEIKARAKGRGTYRTTVNPIFDSFKLNSKLVDPVKRREMLERAERGAGGVEGAEEEDEYGTWDWDWDVDEG